MSEIDPTGEISEHIEHANHQASVTAGSILRDAREAAGLHIAALAVSMKVPVRKLEALEADRIDLLSDAVFVRALASSVCRVLKIDAAPVLELLPQTVKPSFESGDKGINAPFKVPSDTRSGGVIDLMKRPVFVVVSLLLLAVFAVAFVPEVRLPDFVAKPDLAQTSVPLTKSPATESAAVMEKPGGALPSMGVIPAHPPAEPVEQQMPEAVSQPSSAPVDKQVEMVAIRAKGATWVEVIDSTGAVLVRRTLQAEGVTSATGVPPLAVVVGKADMVDIEVRGKPFNASAISKDNVARFEVK